MGMHLPPTASLQTSHVSNGGIIWRDSCTQRLLSTLSQDINAAEVDGEERRLPDAFLFDWVASLSSAELEIVGSAMQLLPQVCGKRCVCDVMLV